MNPIRFRIWHKPTKQHTSREVNRREDGDYLLVDELGVLYIENYGNGATTIGHQEDYLIQRYAFNDQFGTNVYEGDKISFTYQTGPSDFETEESAIVKYDPEVAMFVFGSNEFCMVDGIVRETITRVDGYNGELD